MEGYMQGGKKEKGMEGYRKGGEEGGRI